MVDYEIGCVFFFEKENFLYNKKKINILNGKNGLGYTESKGFFKVENHRRWE